MAPVRRATKSAAKEEVKADKEHREQEVHEAKPDHPMPFPLYLEPYYVCTAPGTLELKDAVVAKVELAPGEKEHVRKALSFVLQAACDLSLSDMGGLPSSLDRNRDIIWDWRSLELSANAYGAFAYGVVNYLMMRCSVENLSYDWTPFDSSKGILSLRKKCGFQSRLTRVLGDVINEAMRNNELLTSLVECVELERQFRASVLTGTVEGVRTPCRCWRFTPKRQEEEARPDDRVCDFVLEVGVGDKTPELRALAESYIRRGTLCVMTVKVERHGEFDFAWSYTLYRRSNARCSPGRVTTYDMVCDAQDARVKTNKHDVVEFPAGLTLFDFVPSSVLKKHGVTNKEDEKAAMNLSMSLEELGETEATLCEPLGEGKAISEHLKELEELL
jgi:hypothetical protein